MTDTITTLPSVRRALILCAGVGRRLHPETQRRPKCLIEVDGTPLLKSLLANLAAIGVRDFVIVTGYRNEMVEAAVASWAIPHTTVKYIENPAYATTNTLVSVSLAADVLRGKPFLLLNGDLWVQREELDKLVRGQDRLAMLVDTQVELDEEAMKVAVNESGRVTAVSKELALAGSAGESIGAYRFDVETGTQFLAGVCERASSGDTRSFYEATLDRLLRDGALAPAEIVRAEEGAWVEIDDHDDLARARTLAAQLRDKKSNVSRETRVGA